MIDRLKHWYTTEYQSIVYSISISKSEYEKVLSFATPTILVLNLIKLFWKTMPWWIIPLLLLFATITAYWVGKWLIKLGVPKKTAELGNAQNPTLMEILEILRKSK